MGLVAAFNLTWCTLSIPQSGHTSEGNAYGQILVNLMSIPENHGLSLLFSIPSKCLAALSGRIPNA